MTESTHPKNADFSDADQLQMIIETAHLPELELGEYCRKKGIYTHDIQACKDEVVQNLSGQKASSFGVDILRALKRRGFLWSCVHD